METEQDLDDFLLNELPAPAIVRTVPPYLEGTLEPAPERYQPMPMWVTPQGPVSIAEMRRRRAVKRLEHERSRRPQKLEAMAKTAIIMSAVSPTGLYLCFELVLYLVRCGWI